MYRLSSRPIWDHETILIFTFWHFYISILPFRDEPIELYNSVITSLSQLHIFWTYSSFWGPTLRPRKWQNNDFYFLRLLHFYFTFSRWTSLAIEVSYNHFQNSIAFKLIALFWHQLWGHVDDQKYWYLPSEIFAFLFYIFGKNILSHRTTLYHHFQSYISFDITLFGYRTVWYHHFQNSIFWIYCLRTTWGLKKVMTPLFHWYKK